MTWLDPNTFEIQKLTPVLRLSGAGTGDEGEAAALKASAKDAGSLEDKQLAEALARFPLSFPYLILCWPFQFLRSASDQSMDTSESKPGTSGASSTASATTPQAASAETFKESDVANIVSMGFAREVIVLDSSQAILLSSLCTSQHPHHPDQG